MFAFSIVGCNDSEPQESGLKSSVPVNSSSSKIIINNEVNPKCDLVKAKRAAVVAITKDFSVN